tara:strand:- start:89 stop:283 length:195 start_codon:yes stop_codon:yes gene_type:complete
MGGTKNQMNRFAKVDKSSYRQNGHPFPVTSCGRRRNHGSPLACYKNYKRKPGTVEFSKGSCIPK